MNAPLLVKAAIAGAIALGTGAALAGGDEKPVSAPEQCTGIVKKGMNDCATSKHQCAGQAVKDGDPEEWVKMPAGLCAKLVGAKLKK